MLHIPYPTDVMLLGYPRQQLAIRIKLTNSLPACLSNGVYSPFGTIDHSVGNTSILPWPCAFLLRLWRRELRGLSALLPKSVEHNVRHG